MKKYLNSLWLAPVLGFLIPLLFVDQIKSYGGHGVISYYWPGFLGILLLNIWNYAICKDVSIIYNILMTILTFLLSLAFFATLDGGRGGMQLGFLVLFVGYFIILLSLTTSIIITTFSKQEIKVDSIKERQEKIKVEEHLSILPSFSWIYISLLFIILLPLINIIYSNSNGFDIIFYIFYLLVFQVNRNFLNSKSIYKIVMLIILIFDTSLYLYITMLGLDNDGWYLVFFPMILILSVILLIIIGKISKNNQDKAILKN